MVEISPILLDVFTEFVNIGVGRAAGILNQMVSSPVTLTVPKIEVFDSCDTGGIEREVGSEALSVVRLTFGAGLDGSAALLFPASSAHKFVMLLTGEQPGSIDIDSLKAETLNEVGSILLNGIMGSIANLCEVHISYSVPEHMVATPREVCGAECGKGASVMIVHALFIVREHMIEGKMLLIFHGDSMRALLDAIKRKL